MNNKVAIIGAGNAGYAMAGDIALGEFDVNLYEMPSFAKNLEPLMEDRRLNLIGALQGTVTLKKVTTNIEEALKEVKYVMVATQAHAHEIIARLCAPYFEDGQIITIMPDNGGSFIFRKILREENIKKNVIIGGTYTLPYGCRKKDPKTIWYHYARDGKNPIAALPNKDSLELANEINKIYQGKMLHQSESNILEIFLQNPNIIKHPIGTLLNIGRIEYSKGEFYMYKEGLTESVCRLIEAADREKTNILKELGLPVRSGNELRKILGRMSQEEFNRDSAKGPVSAKSRYITEDVPIGMVFMASIGEKLGIETPLIKSLITVFSRLNETDYWQQGRTLDVCGLENMSRDRLLEYVEEGTIR